MGKGKSNNKHHSDGKERYTGENEGIRDAFSNIQKRFCEKYTALENNYQKIKGEFNLIDVKPEKFESVLNEFISQYVVQAKLVHCLSEEYKGEKVCFDDVMKALAQCQTLLNGIKDNHSKDNHSKNEIVSLQDACHQARERLDEEKSRLEKKLEKEIEEFNCEFEKELNDNFEKKEKFCQSQQKLNEEFSETFKELEKNYLILNNQLDELNYTTEQSKNDRLKDKNLHKHLNQYGVKDPENFELNKQYLLLLNAYENNNNIDLRDFNIKRLKFNYPLNKVTLSSEQMVFLTEQDAQQDAQKDRILFEQEIVCCDPENLLPEKIKEAFKIGHYFNFSVNHIILIFALDRARCTSVSFPSDESVFTAIKFDLESTVSLLIKRFGIHDVLQKLSQSECLSLEQGQALLKLFSDLLEPQGGVGWKHPIIHISICFFCLTSFNLPRAWRESLNGSTLFGINLEYLIYLATYTFLFFHVLVYGHSLCQSLWEYFMPSVKTTDVCYRLFEELLKQEIQKDIPRKELLAFRKSLEEIINAKELTQKNEERINSIGTSPTRSYLSSFLSYFFNFNSELNLEECEEYDGHRFNRS